MFDQLSEVVAENGQSVIDSSLEAGGARLVISTRGEG